jgi:spore coat polysaccharide biosynthesis protein SpsF
VLRITADCPLLSWEEADRVIAHHLSTHADYTHNVTVWGSGMPLGTGTEIFTFATLDQSWLDGHEPHHREHVDEFVYEHPERFRIERVEAPAALRRPDLRLTVDTAEDLDLIREIQRRLGPERPVPLGEVVALLDGEPELARRNEHVPQKRT